MTSSDEKTLKLLVSLSDGAVRLVPFDDSHIEGLRAACAEDEYIWDIYPISMLGEHFDRSVAMLSTMTDYLRFAVLHEDRVVGMTHFLKPDPEKGIVEIGGTYISPLVRGTSFNRIMKTLMIDHAFASGFHTIAFRIDTRNGRSMRAVEKLGARQISILRKDMTTWTGYVRDAALFELKSADWRKGGQS
ncbi:GNAT family N-acetyltransferase [Pacificimonas sp. WHA3]|uniref:GNAT family N-acetyltransferase n=1 Tax=Pacificimonas pallii TaxID=2827236 RepID=A0ABS6SGW6_9SPHN|nr:GNAT family protein [Pacificimonas pallii]MBV7257131.1 GNAT family N-acetyltransferase [Pacificimonas pallii]